MYFRKLGYGKTVVFLHGWGADGAIYLPIAQKLTDCKCYLLDFNGFGNSPEPPSAGWGVEDYAEELAKFFRQHNLQKACIVAHSFGCRVAMVLAAKYPKLVSKLLLVAPAGLRSFSFTRWCKVRKYKFQKRFCKHKNADSGSADYKDCSAQMRNTFVKVVNQDLSKFARQINCTTLIVCGKEDLETPLRNARKLQKLISDSSLAEIEGGHFAFFQTPDAFAKTVEYFVGGIA